MEINKIFRDIPPSLQLYAIQSVNKRHKKISRSIHRKLHGVVELGRVCRKLNAVNRALQEILGLVTRPCSTQPIPATAANLIETSQLRRRYYSAQVYAQTQRALSIPITLILRWDDHSIRPVRVKAQDRRLYVLSEARGLNTANFPTPGCY
ncbi:unnamed protein product, partial [Brenthis ino]